MSKGRAWLGVMCSLLLVLAVGRALAGEGTPRLVVSEVRVVEDSNSYDTTYGWVARAPGGELWLCGRRALDHVTGGVVGCWTSPGDAKNWSGFIEVYHDPLVDLRGGGGGITSSGNIVVWTARYDPKRSSVENFLDIGWVRSVGDPPQWIPYRILYPEPEREGLYRYNAFGQMVQLPSGRLMQLWYGHEGGGKQWVLKAAFSDDDGLTWPEAVVINDSRKTGIPAGETWALLVAGESDDRARVLAIARIQGGGLRQFVSSDGGRTWQDSGAVADTVAYGNSTPTPATLVDMGDGYVALVWGDRDTFQVKAKLAPWEAVWADGARWADYPTTVLYTSARASTHKNTGDFGYPLGARVGDSLVVWFYDGGERVPLGKDTDVYQVSAKIVKP